MFAELFSLMCYGIRAIAVVYLHKQIIWMWSFKILFNLFSGRPVGLIWCNCKNEPAFRFAQLLWYRRHISSLVIFQIFIHTSTILSIFLKYIDQSFDFICFGSSCSSYHIPESSWGLLRVPQGSQQHFTVPKNSCGFLKNNVNSKEFLKNLGSK